MHYQFRLDATDTMSICYRCQNIMLVIIIDSFHIIDGSQGYFLISYYYVCNCNSTLPVSTQLLTYLLICQFLEA